MDMNVFRQYPCLGALRNNNTRLLNQLGPDTGFDTVGDFEIGFEVMNTCSPSSYLVLVIISPARIRTRSPGSTCGNSRALIRCPILLGCTQQRRLAPGRGVRRHLTLVADTIPHRTPLRPGLRELVRTPGKGGLGRSPTRRVRVVMREWLAEPQARYVGHLVPPAGVRRG